MASITLTFYPELFPYQPAVVDLWVASGVAPVLDDDNFAGRARAGAGAGNPMTAQFNLAIIQYLLTLPGAEITALVFRARHRVVTPIVASTPGSLLWGYLTDGAEGMHILASSAFNLNDSTVVNVEQAVDPATLQDPFAPPGQPAFSDANPIFPFLALGISNDPANPSSIPALPAGTFLDVDYISLTITVSADAAFIAGCVKAEDQHADALKTLVMYDEHGQLLTLHDESAIDGVMVVDAEQIVTSQPIQATLETGDLAFSGDQTIKSRDVRMWLTTQGVPPEAVPKLSARVSQSGDGGTTFGPENTYAIAPAGAIGTTIIPMTPLQAARHRIKIEIPNPEADQNPGNFTPHSLLDLALDIDKGGMT